MRKPAEVIRGRPAERKEIYATLYPENISLLTCKTTERFFVPHSQLLAFKEMYLRNIKKTFNTKL
jgi:hypothetical protein